MEPQQTYSVGDEITLAGEQYYVIENSDSTKDYVTVLKANPLTTTEINTYGGVGTANNHVNQYYSSNQGTAYDWNDANHTGGMQYYSSSTCGYNGSSWVYDGCTTDYAQSEVKYVIDAWSQVKFINGELKTVDGYGSRLATKEELQPIGWPSCTSGYCLKESDTPSWLWNSSYWYWTMSPYNDSSFSVWNVFNDGTLNYYNVYNYGAVRPVLNIYKSKI